MPQFGSKNFAGWYHVHLPSIDPQLKILVVVLLLVGVVSPWSNVSQFVVLSFFDVDLSIGR